MNARTGLRDTPLRIEQSQELPSIVHLLPVLSVNFVILP